MSADLKITPDGAIKWQTHDLHSGRLYLPGTQDDTPDPMNIFDAVDENRNRHKILGMGMEGVVYSIDNYAVKAFVNPAVWDGVATLRANVALTEGLKQIERPEGAGFDITGAEIHAAFIPHNEEEFGYRAIWLMEEIKPVSKPSTYLRKEKLPLLFKKHKENPLPDFDIRREAYTRALALYGLRITDIVNDEADYKDINLMIAKLPNKQAQGRLVKIDERPSYGKTSFSSY